MNVPLRPDPQIGLTAAQFAAMPSRLRERIAITEDPSARAEMENDLPVWEAAAQQVAGQDGKYAILWQQVRAVQAITESLADADPDALNAAQQALTEMGATEHREGQTYVVQPTGDLVRIQFAESGPGTGVVTLAEANAEWDDDNMTVRITPIRPGPGNARDKYWYPPESLREAVKAGKFSNVKMFANHPSRDGSDDKKRPERDINDWVAVVKETSWDESKGRPRSTVQVLDPSVYAKWKRAPEHIAFSVLGTGRARSGRVNGEDMRIVESIEKVRSIDWVTEAGAGGAIDFAESADEEFDMGLEMLTLAQLKEARPDLVDAAIAEADEPADDKTEKAEPKADAEPKAEAKDAEPKAEAKVEGAGSATASTPPAPDGYVSKADFDALKTDFDALKTARDADKIKEAAASARQRAAVIVDKDVRAAGLPIAGRQLVMESFAESGIGEGQTYADETALHEAVETQIEKVRRAFDQALGRKSNVTGMGSAGGDVPEKSLREAKESEINDRLSRGELITSIAESGTSAADVRVSDAGARAADKIASRI